MQPEIDPTTGTYTGERISHLANAIWLRIMTPRGSWWADTTLGSRLHTLSRRKALAGIAAEARDMAIEALKPLVTAGRAQSIDVDTALEGSLLVLGVRVTDATGQRSTHQFEVVL